MEYVKEEYFRKTGRLHKHFHFWLYFPINFYGTYMRCIVFFTMLISCNAYADLSLVKIPLFLKGSNDAFSGEKLRPYAGPKVSSIDTVFIEDYPIFESWFGDPYIFSDKGLIYVDDVNFLIKLGVLPGGTTKIPTAFAGYGPGYKYSCNNYFLEDPVLNVEKVNYSYDRRYKINSIGVSFLFTKSDGLVFSDFSDHIYKIDSGFCKIIKNEEFSIFNRDFSEVLVHEEASKFKGIIIKGERKLFFWNGGEFYNSIKCAKFSDFGKYFFIFGSVETGDGFIYSKNGLWRLKDERTLEKINNLNIGSVDSMFDIPGSGAFAFLDGNKIKILNDKMEILETFLLNKKPVLFEAIPLYRFNITVFRLNDGVYAISESSNKNIKFILDK